MRQLSRDSLTPQAEGLIQVQEEVIHCRRCPRLVRWREKVAHEKVARFAGETYWGKAVPSFGDLNAQLLIVGLAPAAHGANRTGRMFTGDRSGEWLYRAMHKSGFANQSTSAHRDDGLTLSHAYVTATLRCAPPLNKPLPEELTRCRPFLIRELHAFGIATTNTCPKVVVALGKVAYDNFFKCYAEAGEACSHRARNLLTAWKSRCLTHGP